MMMKPIQALGLCLLLAGCATVPRKPVTSFDDAVRGSVEAKGIHPRVVVTMDKDGSMSIAGLPIKMDELKQIRSVAGLPENPPGVLIRAHREATHADVKAALDELSKSGIWRISFQAVKPEEWHNQAPDTARKLADPQR
jgi:hypothetical protein